MVAEEPEPSWPTLNAPLTPASDLWAEVTAAKPTLDDSPYGARPATATPGEARVEWSQLQPPPRVEPLQRDRVEATYTKHVVTDGDTLRSIAERYLGDPTRAEELFELNRDRLEHPEVLPIGMVLRTPEATHGAAAAPPQASTGFPRLEREGNFSTVSAADAYMAPPAVERRPMQAVGVSHDVELSRAEQLGPVDPVFQSEYSWDANRW